MFTKDLKCQNQSQIELWRPDCGLQGIIEDIWFIFKETYGWGYQVIIRWDLLFSSTPGLNNIPNLTAIIQKATGVPLSTAQQMDIVENQALMDDNTALLPQRGRAREHCSINQTIKRILIRSQQMSLMIPYDCGDGSIVVFKSDFGGQLKPSHKGVVDKFHTGREGYLVKSQCWYTKTNSQLFC